jgi:hypothetical protein
VLRGWHRVAPPAKLRIIEMKCVAAEFGGGGRQANLNLHEPSSPRSSLQLVART